MRAKVLVVLLSVAFAAALLPLYLETPSWLRTVAQVLAAWTAISLAATGLLAAWVRSASRAQEAFTRAARRAAWKGQLAAR